MTIMTTAIITPAGTAVGGLGAARRLGRPTVPQPRPGEVGLIGR